jgi:hypothetical protein
MKPAIHERLSDLIDAARRLQHALDAERADAPLPTFFLCRLAIDVDETVGRLERQAEAITNQAPQGKGQP